MFEVSVNKDVGRIILRTDDSSVKYMFESIVWEKLYVKGKSINVPKNYKIYDNGNDIKDENGNYVFIFNYGWASYLLRVFKGYLSVSDYDALVRLLMSDTYRTIPFQGLRDYQNEDVLHLLRYNIGLFSCFTSYGKTQLIAVLAQYFYSLGKRVILITPGKKACDELKKRLKSLYGIETPSEDGRIGSIITSGLLNRKDVRDPQSLALLEKDWATYDVILCDEVEYCVNSESGQFLFDRLIGAEKRYAFSGTADKQGGEMIGFKDGLDENVMRNRNLVKYFGPSIIYRLPTTMNVNMIKIKTSAFAGIKFPESDFNEGNIYLKVITRLFTSPEFCNLLIKIIKRYPKLYTPVNNLQNIINYWIDNWLIGKFRILLICAEGYIYYDLDGTRKKLKDLSEACDYVRDDKVDFIPSTSAGFRALDLPGLKSVLVLTGKLAGVVIQSIGRCGRGTDMNIIGIDTISGRKIPIYSKGMAERDELIKGYYTYCNIVESEIYETSL